MVYIYSLIFVLALIAFVIIRLFKKKRDRDALINSPFPQNWETILENNFSLYKLLPDHLKTDLKNIIKVLVSEKNFIGCQDLIVTDEMKVLITAQASILLLNRKTKYYPKLKTIYIYPSTYVTKHQVNLGGIIVDQISANLGESWNSGEIVLAWDSVEHGARNMFDGKNVVYHEFAHRLDQEDGLSDGAPILKNRSAYISWGKILSHEYEILIKKKKKHKKSVLNKYGATNPAEFFAVATESFFEKPRQLFKKMPELYNELASYYEINPLEWDN